MYIISLDWIPLGLIELLLNVRANFFNRKAMEIATLFALKLHGTLTKIDLRDLMKF